MPTPASYVTPSGTATEKNDTTPVIAVTYDVASGPLSWPPYYYVIRGPREVPPAFFRTYGERFFHSCTQGTARLAGGRSAAAAAAAAQSLARAQRAGGLPQVPRATSWEGVRLAAPLPPPGAAGNQIARGLRLVANGWEWPDPTHAHPRLGGDVVEPACQRPVGRDLVLIHARGVPDLGIFCKKICWQRSLESFPYRKAPSRLRENGSKRCRPAQKIHPIGPQAVRRSPI